MNYKAFSPKAWRENYQVLKNIFPERRSHSPNFQVGHFSDPKRKLNNVKTRIIQKRTQRKKIQFEYSCGKLNTLEDPDNLISNLHVSNVKLTDISQHPIQSLSQANSQSQSQPQSQPHSHPPTQSQLLPNQLSKRLSLPILSSPIPATYREFSNKSEMGPIMERNSEIVGAKTERLQDSPSPNLFYTESGQERPETQDILENQLLILEPEAANLLIQTHQLTDRDRMVQLGELLALDLLRAPIHLRGASMNLDKKIPKPKLPYIVNRGMLKPATLNRKSAEVLRPSKSLNREKSENKKNSPLKQKEPEPNPNEKVKKTLLPDMYVVHRGKKKKSLLVNT